MSRSAEHWHQLARSGALIGLRREDPLALTYHGVSYGEQPESGVVYFGMLRLLWLLLLYRRPRLPSDPPLPEWPSIWLDRMFDQAVSKFQDCIWKFDRVAGHLAKSVDEFRHHRHPTTMTEMARFQAALGDVPIQLDSMLLYLRIQADCMANVLPCFYGQRGKKANIPRDSFRRQARWFEKTPTFDPDYTAMLLANLQWFEMLAGESRGQGLRDIVVHRRGTWQVGWAEPAWVGGEADIIPWLVGDHGTQSALALPRLKSLVAGYFGFLDHAFMHFAGLLRSELGTGYLPGRMATELYSFRDGLPPSVWVYPTISD